MEMPHSKCEKCLLWRNVPEQHLFTSIEGTSATDWTYHSAIIFLSARTSFLLSFIAQTAPLAQLDRASDYESEGREFESLRARHSLICTQFHSPRRCKNLLQVNVPSRRDEICYLSTGSRFELTPQAPFSVFRDNRASSNYNAMEFKLERRFSRGLMLRGSYTLSRGWDDASEVYQITPISPFPQDQLNAGNARKGEHGLSAYDVTHRFAIAYVYEVPGFSSSNNLLNHIAYLTRGWQWSSTASLQSGLPNTPFVGGIDTNGDGNALNGRPNVGNPNAPAGTAAIDGAFLGAPFAPGYLYVAFSGLPTDASQVRWLIQPGIGNIQRNGYREPGIVTWNTSIARNFRVPYLGEKSSFQIRADMFNVLNHANESAGLDMNVLDVQDPPNAAAPYFGNPHYARTGARTMRLAAKFTF